MSFVMLLIARGYLGALLAVAHLCDGYLAWNAARDPSARPELRRAGADRR
jgi:hypothetical protein